ncbi:hypothetical protein CK621_01330 [Vandammella animalimorsus]|uniref:Uncharacterized protein n=1 Tax=Vandammella animalimorsus TaxID=2029117 RepID=A0A2A2AZ91_9BURK|nr:hypothetical protein CK621_01330 [Vandammella animalimorsus]
MNFAYGVRQILGPGVATGHKIAAPSEPVQGLHESSSQWALRFVQAFLDGRACFARPGLRPE